MASLKPRLLRAYLIAFAAWALVFAFSLRLGAVPDAGWDLIRDLRLPRAILASAVGMGLAVAGASLQALFANPLCEPYTLGISSGSALGAVVGISLGFNWMLAGLGGTAFLGALVFTSILYFISLRSRGSNLLLLLAGVMLGFMGSSLVAVWMALADPNGIQGAMIWLLGDLSRARLQGSVITLGLALLFCSALWGRWRALDSLMMGEEDARSLGVDVSSERRKVILNCAFLIALCVSASGMIGFVGLVIPHFSRKFVGSLHQRLLPLCAIWGAVALTLADCVARIAARPYELPAGAVTAVIGAPVFLWVMLQRPKAVA